MKLRYPLALGLLGGVTAYLLPLFEGWLTIGLVLAAAFWAALILEAWAEEIEEAAKQR